MKKALDIIKNHPIIAVLILGGIVRLIFLISYFHSPEWGQLVVDSLFHHRWAQAIAAGDIIGDQVFFRAPLYIYILGLIYYIVGPSLLFARIFGHIVGLISVYFTFRIGRTIFNRPAGLMAALLHALYPIAVFFESELLVDNLFTMLFELSILLIIYAVRKRQNKYYIMAGIIIGLAAITRPLILGLLPVYIIWIFIGERSFRFALLKNLLLLLIAFAVILPVSIRNKLVGDDFVLVSSSGGINFYIGNNPSADGLTASMPRPLGHNWEINDITRIAEDETGHQLKPSEVSSFWLDKALDWIKSNNSDFIRLYLKKIYYCFNNYEISNNKNLNVFYIFKTFFHVIT